MESRSNFNSTATESSYLHLLNSVDETCRPQEKAFHSPILRLHFCRPPSSSCPAAAPSFLCPSLPSFLLFRKFSTVQSPVLVFVLPPPGSGGDTWVGGWASNISQRWRCLAPIPQVLLLTISFIPLPKPLLMSHHYPRQPQETADLQTRAQIPATAYPQRL